MNASPLKQNVLIRLGFIKYLYSLGVSQSTQPRPINSSCLLTFHDAVENFILLSCSEKEVRINDRTSIKQYIDKLKEDKGVVLTWADWLSYLNKHRRELKHYGIFPSNEAIFELKTNISRFFEENTLIIFNVSFEELSMSYLVSSDRVRDLLRESEDHKKEGQRAQAVRKCAGALHILLDEYRKNVSKDWDSAIFDFGNERTVEDALPGHNDRYNNVRKFAKAYDRMSDAITIIGFGIDYRKYAKFMMIAPGVTKMSDGSVHYGRNKDLSNITPAEFQFCYDFVIETALKLQEFAIDPDALSTTRTAKKAGEWNEKARRMMAEQERSAE